MGWATHYIAKLKEGEIVQFRPKGNSMTGRVNSGDLCTVEPIKDFSQMPRIFFDMHKETMEMVHFSSWFHAIQHRYHYTNDILHDLYYHHEFFHINTMTYKNNWSFNEWKNKMDSNEFWASLESEVLIYFYMPQLRDLSFKNDRLGSYF